MSCGSGASKLASSPVAGCCKVIRRAGAGDHVYCDPPYVPPGWTDWRGMKNVAFFDYTMVEPDGLARAPTIVATEESRVILEAGNRAFVKGIGDSKEPAWYVYRQGAPLVDPDTNTTLGYEAVYLGTARVARSGEPAVVQLTSVTQEVGVGDKLVPAGKPEVPTYAPRAPSGQIQGRVISMYGKNARLGETGPQTVISINRGRAQGLEVGHVLALYRPGATVADASRPRDDSAAKLTLPNERYGLAFVFRVFDKVSYALVMSVSRPVNPLDVVQNP